MRQRRMPRLPRPHRSRRPRSDAPVKPLRLEIRGFTAFRESTVVEFDGRRLFVITGPTGAGKSSLLDAMIWALYGQVPRVGNRTRQLITHGEKSMSVRFDFTARGETYRVSRRAPATTGTRLERQIEGDSWQPLADRARDVTAQVTEILGVVGVALTKYHHVAITRIHADDIQCETRFASPFMCYTMLIGDI